MSCCPPGAHGYLEPQGDGQGKKTTAGGIEVYEAGEVGKTLLVLLPDIWGWHSGRIRSVADDLAKRGFFVSIPKLLPAFEGGTDDDALPPNFNVGERIGEVFPLFAGDWSASITVPKVEKVLAHYAGKGVEKAALYGFCYGGWVGFHLASEKRALPIVCAASSHPSIHIEGLVGGDPVALAKKQMCPWLFQPCGVVGAEGSDPDIYDVDGAVFKELEALNPGKNVTTRFPEEAHGFVTRGAITTGIPFGEGDKVKADIAKAVEEVVSFMEKNGAK